MATYDQQVTPLRRLVQSDHRTEVLKFYLELDVRIVRSHLVVEFLDGRSRRLAPLTMGLVGDGEHGGVVVDSHPAAARPARLARADRLEDRVAPGEHELVS